MPRIAAANVPLMPEHFKLPAHRAIFSVALALDERSVPVDAVTVCDELQRSGTLATAGGSQYVHALPSAVPSAYPVLRAIAALIGPARPGRGPRA